MRLLLVTGVVSRHLLPLARCMADCLGHDGLRFAATKPVPSRSVTFSVDAEANEPWILRAGTSETDRAELMEWWHEADVVICGLLDMQRMGDRLGRGKLTFYMSERWWKPPLGMARLLHPRFAWMAAQFCNLARSTWFHYLPIGGYATTDMRRMTSFHGRMWDWGYFTTVPDHLPPCRERDGALRVLWAGRMLPWKRVDTLVRAFALLLQQGPEARLALIGEGPCREELGHLARELGIAGKVDFHASILAAQVRDQMRNSHVYVLPSSAYEGWGAVLNEAMSEGCAVVASEAAGSAKAMLRHGENGLLFLPGDSRQLASLLVQLNSDELLRLRLAEAGQRAISECWSPEVAAGRFLAVSDALLSKRPVPSYSRGPMARSGP